MLTLGVNKDVTNPAIYYYNEQTKSLELIGGEVDGETITATVNHFSTYGVFTEVAKEEPPVTDIEEEESPVTDIEEEETKKDTSDKLPKTATNMYNWLLIGVAFLLIAFLILVTSKKRKKEN